MCRHVVSSWSPRYTVVAAEVAVGQQERGVNRDQVDQNEMSSLVRRGEPPTQ